MNDNALISISSTQEIEGEKQTFALDTGGKYAIRNNKVYIVYDESPITGYEDTTTTIKISDGGVSVSRKGRYTAKTEYICGEKSLCILNTPYGQIGAAVTTENIDYKFGDKGGTLKMEYLLDADNQTFIKNNMKINVELKTENSLRR